MKRLALTFAVSQLVLVLSGLTALPANDRFPDFRALSISELDELKAYFRDSPMEQPFRLSQNYPTDRPPAEEYPWKKYNPTTQWKEYLQAVLKYCYDGNQSVGWNSMPPAGEDRRTWYHAPWLHWGRNGREAIHGMTHERPSQPGELAHTQVSVFQNWAVSVYNRPGGYTLGKVWRDRQNPDATQAVFPEGTVAIKLLFTQANKNEVPYLDGAPSWKAQIYESVVIPTNPNLRRRIQDVRLLQIDVAVRDPQVEHPRVPGGTGWVFGTFTYHSKAPGATPWEKVEPIGIMWGNDPGVRVADVRNGATLKETIISRSSELPFQHLGWGGRLNGPVDNPISSCLSCHSTSQWPPGGFSIVPGRDVPPDSPKWMEWFRNIKAGQPFTPGKTSLDYSLQLSVGMQNFREWSELKTSMGGDDDLGIPPNPAGLRPKLRAAPLSRGGDE